MTARREPLTEELERLDQQAEFCRKRLGLPALADRIGLRLCDRLGEYARQNPAQVKIVRRVGIYKGGL